MLSLNAQQATIEFLLAKLRESNPDVIPENWMTDFDQAQINAIKTRYPESKHTYLCSACMATAYHDYSLFRALGTS